MKRNIANDQYFYVTKGYKDLFSGVSLFLQKDNIGFFTSISEFIELAKVKNPSFIILNTNIFFDYYDSMFSWAVNE